MGTLTLADFKAALAAVLPGVAGGRGAVYLSSRIWTFAHRLDVPVHALPDRLLDAIWEVLGSGVTLIMPAFTNSFARTRRFDRVWSKPETGLLVEAFLARGETMRSPSAMDSYAVAGPLAHEVSRLQGRTLWGEGSVLEWMELNDTRMCPLGLPWHQGSPLYHRGEELLQVPYRYFKAFRGTWSSGGENPRPWSEVMYVRPLGVPIRWRYDRITEHLVKRAPILRSPVPDLPLQATSARAMMQAVTEALRADPYLAVENRAEVQHWVAEKKAAEVSGLAESERPSFPCER